MVHFPTLNTQGYFLPRKNSRACVRTTSGRVQSLEINQDWDYNFHVIPASLHLGLLHLHHPSCPQLSQGPNQEGWIGFELHLLLQAQIQISKYKSVQPPALQEIAFFFKTNRKSEFPVLNPWVQGGIFPLAARYNLGKEWDLGGGVSRGCSCISAGTQNPNPVPAGTIKTPR